MVCSKRQTYILCLKNGNLGTKNNRKTDHQDGNGLNNQRYNIRECTNSQNAMNSQIIRKHSSQFKGVSWFKRDKKWRSYIDYPQKHIGYFNSEIEAAKAYDMRAKELFGEFAYLNFK